MGTICLQCGDRGVTNAFVYCVRCLDVAVHRYCLDVIPRTVDEYVPWRCDDCCLKMRKQPLGFQNRSKNRELLSDAGGYSQSCTESCPEEFQVSDEKRRLNTSSSQQREEENLEDDLMQQKKLLVDSSREDGPRRRRRLVKLSDKERDQCKLGSNFSKRPSMEAAAIDSGSVSSSGKRDYSDFCQQPSESDTKTGTAERRNVSFTSSQKKTLISSVSNIDEERQRRAVFSQPRQENKWLGLEKSCSDTSTVEGSIDRSNDLTAIRESKISEERTSACNPTGDLPEDLAKDLNITSTIDCYTPAEPVLEPIWRGSFNVWNKEELIEGFMAHMSSGACQKAYDEASQFELVLQLEMLPKLDIWPKSFESSQPSVEHIALYFFPSNMSEMVYDRLVDEMQSEELAMRAIVPNAELLVFTSVELQLPNWRFQGKYYLWGVFRGRQPLPASPSQTYTRELTGNRKMLADINPDSNSGRVPMAKEGCGCAAGSGVSSLGNSSCCSSSSNGCGS